MANGTGYVALTLTVEKEGKQFVSRCVDLGTASCGDSFDEALANIEEATIEYLNTIERLGERSRIFEEKGITIRKSRPSRVALASVALHPGAFIGPYVTKVPA
jgi:predicted RNase H-like HicB family nuclease